MQTLSSRNVEIFDIDGNIIIQFTDKFINDNYFIRTIKGTQHHIVNNNILVNIKENKNMKFIDKITQDNNINNNIITLDLETMSTLENNEELMKVISCCIYDGVNKISFYLSDYNSSDQLLRDCIKSLMNNKYDGYKVYVHNLSRFDGIFLIKILASMNNTKLTPIN